VAVRRFPRVFGLAVVAGVVACSGSKTAAPPVPKTPGVVGASIAVVSNGARVAVVNPDQGSVSFLDPSSLAVLGTTVVGGEPHALLEAVSGTLLVTTYGGGEVVAIDESTGNVSHRVSVCAGAYGIAASADATWVAVGCEWDGTVQHLDLASYAVSAVTSGLHRPRAVAVLGDDVYVADYIGGLVHDIAGSGDTVTSLVPTSAPYRPALSLMTANLTAAILPAFGTLLFAHVLENNTGNSSAEPVADDYGSVTSTNPKINPSVTTLGEATPVLYAQYDGGSRVYSGPSALAAFGSRYVLVAHVSTANVAVLDTQATTPGARAVGTFSVGFGPSGIAVDVKSNVAFVDNALDQSVSRISLSQPFATGAPVFAADVTLVRDLPSPYSADALSGRRLFFDATNPHVTPSGVVACASCHPNGSDDGLVWFIHTPNIPLKRRRTPNLANSKTPTAPFHWNGQFTTMSDLTEFTMVNLMAGDGLLVDTTTIQPFVDEIVTTPALPVTDAAAVARGETLYMTAGTTPCAHCHSGDYTTDDLLHIVLDPMSLESDDVIPQSNTPGLRGVFLRAPYFHDGRSSSLTDLLTRSDATGMHPGETFAAGDVSDLVAYLSSL
jgi:DNA-binding beta-propeller fold protein YncE